MTTASMRNRLGTFRLYLLGGGLGPFLIRSLAGSGAVQIAGMAVTFLVGVQLARGLGLEGYGYYGIAMAAVSLASVPGEYGIPRLVVREVAAASASDDRPRLFGVLRWADRAGLLIGLGLAVAVALVAFAIAGPDDTAVIAIFWGAPIIPLVALARNRGAALQGLQHVVRGQVPFMLVRPLAFALLLFAMFLAWPGAGARHAMALNGLTAAGALLVGHLWLSRRLPARPATAMAAGGNWLKSALSMALADGMRVTQLQLVILLLGLLASVSATGLFRVAVSILVAIALPITVMNSIVAPVMARLYAEGDHRRLQQMCTHSARWMTAGVFTLSLPFVFWGAPLIGFVFGAEYAPAAMPLLILAGGQIVTACFGVNIGLLMMTGHEQRVTRAMFWGLLASLVLTLALVPAWSEIGGAVATVGALLVWNLLTWIDAHKFLGIETSAFATRARLARFGPGPR